MSEECAWDVYSKALFPQGHGYPLWAPDVEPSLGWEVEIADVGWLRTGEFQHLVRCRSPQTPGEGRVLPDGYERFDPPNIIISGPREKITQPVLYSRSIKSVNISGGVSASIPLLPSTPGGNISFQCTDDQGALLLLSSKGEETFISSKRHIVNYIRTHLDNWVKLANETYGLEKEREDFYFVCGVTKTRRWGVAAFRGERRGMDASVSCDFGALGSADISLSFSDANTPLCWHRTGPPRAGRSPRQSIASAPPVPYLPSGSPTSQRSFQTGSSSSVSTYETAPRVSSSSLPAFGTQYAPSVQTPSGTQVAPDPLDRADQCIFFHYYKAKRKFWIFPQRIEAGAGPHELPPREDDTVAGEGVQAPGYDSDGSVEFHMPTAEGKPYDPVNAVLDYILANSEAKLAIASDLDLYALFKENFPDDVSAGLAELKPVVEVDENDVGTLSVDYAYNRKRPGEEDPEGTPSRKRATSTGDAPDSGDTPEGMDVDAQPDIFSGIAPDSIAPNPPPAPQGSPDPGKAKEVPRHVIGDPTTHDGSITALAYSADGQYLASGAEDTCIIVWYARDGAVKRKLAAHDDTISALAFSPNNVYLASSSDYGPIKLWNIDALDQPPLEVDPGVFVRSLAFTPDGSKLLGGASNGAFLVWNVGNLQRVDITQHAAVVTFIVFSPDGSMMATGGTESTCRIWEVADIDSGTPKKVLVGHKGMVSSASFAPDGRRIITGSDDASCCIWSTESGLVLVNLHEHTGPVWSVAFSPDGQRVVSGSSDSTVKVCDAWTGERLLSLDAHDNMINSVAYSPDGRYIASASSDNTVRLWNAEDGGLVRTYNEHSDNVTSVRFSPDGSTLASGAHDGTVYIRQLGVAA